MLELAGAPCKRHAFIFEEFPPVSPSRLLASLRRYATPSGAALVLRSLRDRGIVAKSPLFDREWYLREHPDVGLSGVDPVLHYLTAGHAAGLSPSASFCGPEYAALHRLPRTVNPVVHYETIGRKTGLPTSFLRPEDAVSTEETLLRIQTKAVRGEPLRAVFLVASAAMFPARPLFDAMLRDPRFAPEIIVVPDLRWKGDSFDPTAAMQRCSEELTATLPPGRLRMAQPGENGCWPDLLAAFDFAVFPSPYDLSSPQYNPRWLTGRPVLGLYANYGYPCTKFALPVLGMDSYTRFWKVFLESDQALRHYREASPIGGTNGCVVGDIKMDALPPCVPHSRKRVLLAPHHSVEGGLNENLALSNFLRLADDFAALPNQYPEIDFVLRPHPFLFPVLARKDFWGKVRCEAWKNAWLAHPNAFWSEDGAYLDEFAASDAIIQDCSSFLMEYLYTGNPCCYILKAPSDIEEKFLPDGQSCLRTCHLAYRAGDIDEFLRDTVLGGHDPHAADRAALARRILVNHPHAADAALTEIKQAFEPNSTKGPAAS